MNRTKLSSVSTLVLVLMVTVALLAATKSPLAVHSASLKLECKVTPTEVGIGENISCEGWTGDGVPPYTWVWTANGETIATLNNTTDKHMSFNYAFSEGGSYNLTVRVTDSGGGGLQCFKYITVIGPPIVTCNVAPNPTKKDHPTSFTANASGGVLPYRSWVWTINGVPKAWQQNFTHTFTEPGNYNACVSVTDDSGKVGQCCQAVTVNRHLKLECQVTPTTVGVGEQVNCQAWARDGVPPYSWLWKINGETKGSFYSTGYISFNTAFNETGNYTICVNVTDSLDNSLECPKTVTVTCQPPVAQFTASPTSGCTPLTVRFTDSSQGATTCYWTFTGGSPATASGPGPHDVTYSSPGTYTVTLNVANACGEDTEVGYITAQYCPPPPSAPAGGGGCPTTRYLTVDWDGSNTTKPLYSDDRLVVDLLGLNPDGRHSLWLAQGTGAPVVAGQRYYLITIRELDLEDLPPLPQNTMAIVAVSITPTGAVFDRDVILTLSFSRLPENALEETVRLAFHDDANRVWVPVESTQGKRDGMTTISAALRHLTVFAVLVEVAAPPPTEAAHFVASDLNVVPAVERGAFVTKTGQRVAIAFNLRNDGGREGIYAVELKLNGKTVDSKTVTLGAGQSQHVSFTQSGLQYGRYEVEVAGLRGEFTASRTITWWPIVLIVVVLGLIIWGALWWIRRRRKGQGRKSKGRAAPAA